MWFYSFLSKRLIHHTLYRFELLKLMHPQFGARTCDRWPVLPLPCNRRCRQCCPYRVVGDVDRIEAGVEVDVEHEAVVGPRAELHVAGLFVVGEVEDVDVTRALQDRHRDPQHVAIAVDDSQRVTVLPQTDVRATGGRRGADDGGVCG